VASICTGIDTLAAEGSRGGWHREERVDYLTPGTVGSRLQAEQTAQV